MLTLLIACAPWETVAERERPWWEDAARLEEVEGIDLVELPSGEPVGYWPRVVVRRDRIDLDARAWFLALDPGLLGAEGVVDQVIDETVMVFDAEPTGPPEGLQPLLDRLEELRRVMDTLDRGGGPLLVVPDASVRGETVARVAYTASLAGFGSYTLAGAAEGRVRAAWAHERECPVAVTLRQDVIVGEGGAKLLPAGGSCPSAPSRLTGALEALWVACGPIWDEMALDERCLGATVAVGDADAGTLLTTLGTLHGTDGRLRTEGIAWGPGEGGPCDGAVPVDALDPQTLARVCGRREPEARRVDDDRIDRAALLQRLLGELRSP